MFVRKSAQMFIYFSSSHVRLLLEVGALLLNAVKHCVFQDSAAALIALRFKRCQGYSGGALSIKNATGCYVFLKSVAVLIFVRLIMLILGAAFFREYTVWIAVYAGFVTFVDNLYYICGRYYICGFILFFFSNNRNNLVIRCEKHNLRKSGKLVKNGMVILNFFSSCGNF